MRLHLCPQCLGETDFICEGHDENWKRFNLYRCPTCKSHVREFALPESSHIVTHALSDKPEQLRMFPQARRSED